MTKPKIYSVKTGWLCHEWEMNYEKCALHWWSNGIYILWVKILFCIRILCFLLNCSCPSLILDWIFCLRQNYGFKKKKSTQETSFRRSHCVTTDAGLVSWLYLSHEILTFASAVRNLWWCSNDELKNLLSTVYIYIYLHSVWTNIRIHSHQPNQRR